ncbi:3D domain-containing protein [Lysinibacillus sp. FSL H8-0500]|uniref:3D domain-containing protein n=1 Tax=Lysinibacillus sp. FSL H8-0500 TaxID=2921393 RepID=UPI00310166E5
MMNYKGILVVYFMTLCWFILLEHTRYDNHSLDYREVFQNAPKYKYEKAVIVINSKAEQLKKEKYLKQLALQKLRVEQELHKEQQKQIQHSRSENSHNEWVNFHATYYGHDCRGCSGITATGINVRNRIYFNHLRIVAVDPTIIPLGTIVEIQTPYERFKAIAADKGGAIKGHRLDILVESERIAAQYGRHDVQLLIIK